MGGQSGAKMREALRNFIEATVGVSVLQGEVKSIDESKWTCDVELPNTLLLYDVQLKCLKETERGSVLVPKVGSWVQIMNVGEPDWLVIAIEQLDKVIVLADTELQIDAAGSTVLVNKDGINVKGGTINADGGGSTIKVDKNGIVMNGGSNRGLVKLAMLEQNLTSLKNFVEAIHAALPTAFDAVGIGSAASGTAGQLSYEGSMVGYAITLQDMENKKVKH